MAKRKTVDSELGDAPVTRRSTRLKTTPKEEEVPSHEDVKPVKKGKAGVKKATPVKDEEKEVKQNDTPPAKAAKPAAAAKPKPASKEEEAPAAGGRQYWLLKAEPESRLEKGHDVKFSIDDLAAKKEPEPWDGIRSYAARNNLRAMKKGDLAFFYHSSCKVPAIVGTMEIVREHSPDLTAQDPKAAYHDPKDTDPSNPRWSVVHVVFKEKFDKPLTLHEMKELQRGGCKEIQGLQLLTQSRLSVSKVSKGEWEFLNEVIRDGVAVEKEGEEGMLLA